MKYLLRSFIIIAVAAFSISAQVTVTITNWDDGYADDNDTLLLKGTNFTGSSIDILRVYYYKDQAAQTPSYMNISSHNLYFDTDQDTIGGKIWDIGELPAGTDSVRIRLFDEIDGDYSNYVKADDVPPSAPSIFSVSAQGADLDSARFLWQGAGDNGSSGTAASCEIRFARSLIDDETKWANADALPCAEPTPLVATSLQTFYCNMYDYGDSTYYYAIKFTDNMGNVSALKYYTSGVNTKPVELSSFSAVMINGAVNLAWRTESETDNAKWRLERSTSSDGADPVVVYAMRKDAAIYTTNFPTDYEYEDGDVDPEGTYYYTLYDIALDGRETAHGPVSTNGLSIFNGTVVDAPLVLNAPEPNPVRYRAALSFSISGRAFAGETAGRVTMDVRSMDGRRSFTVFDQPMSVGQYRGIVWNRGQAEPGVYVVRLVTDSHSVTRRLMVVGR